MKQVSAVKMPKFILDFLNILDTLTASNQSIEQVIDRFGYYYQKNPARRPFIVDYIKSVYRYRKDPVFERVRNIVLHYRVKSPSSDFLANDDLKELKKRGPKQEYLNRAARFGAIKCFRFLMENNCKPDKNTCREAIYGGNLDIIKSVYKNDNQNLFYALESQRNDIADWILQQTNQNADEDIDKYIKTYNLRAIFYRIASKASDFCIDDLLYYFADKEFIDFTIQSGGEIKNPSFCLIQAILANNLEHTKYFIEEKYADITQECETYKGKISAIQAAAYTNDEEIISYVFSNFAKIETKTVPKFNSIEVFNMLVSAGFDKESLIKFSCLDGNFDIFEELTENETELPDYYLQLACKSYHSGILEYVLSKCQAPLTISLFNDVFYQRLSYQMEQNTRLILLLEGTTKTVKEAVESEVIKLLNVLIQKGLDINSRIPQSQDLYETPLTLALKGGYSQVAAYLVKDGANINIAATNEVNDEIVDVKPLFYAIEYGDISTVKALLVKGASWQGTVRTPDGLHSALSLAVRWSKVDTVRFLLLFGFSDPCSYLHINTNEKEKAQKILTMLVGKRVPVCEEVDVLKIAEDLDMKNNLYEAITSLETVPIDEVIIPADPDAVSIFNKEKELSTRKNANDQGKSACCLLI